MRDPTSAFTQKGVKKKRRDRAVGHNARNLLYSRDIYYYLWKDAVERGTSPLRTILFMGWKGLGHGQRSRNDSSGQIIKSINVSTIGVFVL